MHVNATLETYVSVLRRKLARPNGEGRGLITTGHEAYALPTAGYELDLARFDELVRLAEVAEPSARRRYLEDALALVTGSVLADEPYSDWAIDERWRYERRVIDTAIAASAAAMADRDARAALCARRARDRDRAARRARLSRRLARAPRARARPRRDRALRALLHHDRRGRGPGRLRCAARVAGASSSGASRSTLPPRPRTPPRAAERASRRARAPARPRRRTRSPEQVAGGDARRRQRPRADRGRARHRQDDAAAGGRTRSRRRPPRLGALLGAGVGHSVRRAGARAQRSARHIHGRCAGLPGARSRVPGDARALDARGSAHGRCARVAGCARRGARAVGARARRPALGGLPTRSSRSTTSAAAAPCAA